MFLFGTSVSIRLEELIAAILRLRLTFKSRLKRKIKKKNKMFFIEARGFDFHVNFIAIFQSCFVFQQQRREAAAVVIDAVI